MLKMRLCTQPFSCAAHLNQTNTRKKIHTAQTSKIVMLNTQPHLMLFNRCVVWSYAENGLSYIEIYTQFYIYLLDNKCSKEFDIYFPTTNLCACFNLSIPFDVYAGDFFYRFFVMYDKWPFYNLNRSIQIESGRIVFIT